MYSSFFFLQELHLVCDTERRCGRKTSAAWLTCASVKRCYRSKMDVLEREQEEPKAARLVWLFILRLAVRRLVCTYLATTGAPLLLLATCLDDSFITTASTQLPKMLLIRQSRYAWADTDRCRLTHTRPSIHRARQQHSPNHVMKD